MATAAKAAKKVSKPNAGSTRSVTPLSALAAAIGTAAMPRTKIIKKVWHYMETNKLQSAASKHTIHADATLQALFEGKKK